MATVKVKLRNSTVAGKAGTVYYQLSHRGKSQQITTRIHLFPDEWNSNTGQVISSFRNVVPIQKQIDNDLMHLKHIIKLLDRRGKTYTVNDIVRRYKTANSPVSVLAFMQMQIEF